MQVTIKYSAYELNSIMGNEKYKALEIKNPTGWRSEFDTEEELIKALIESECFYKDYVILKSVYISNY